MKNKKNIEIVLGLSLFMVIQFSQMNSSPAIRGDSILKDSLYRDTSECKTKQIGEEEFAVVLKEKIKKTDFLFSDISAPPNHISHIYFTYNKSSGFYFLYQAITDRSGIVKEFILKQNLYTDKRYSRKIKKKIDKINACIFTVDTLSRKYFMNSCYASDGNDNFFFVISGGQLIKGTNSIKELLDNKESHPESCFIMMVTDLYYSLLGNVSK